MSKDMMNLENWPISIVVLAKLKLVWLSKTSGPDFPNGGFLLGIDLAVRVLELLYKIRWMEKLMIGD
jgi:hypothetical protein